MFNFLWQIILLIIVLGGVIAYFGNYIGKYIGKRRLTVFNLRPRYTATLITILAGILIAFSTAGVLLLVSQDARTALLGLDKLKNEIDLRTVELKAANDNLVKKTRELAEIERELAGVRREVKAAREGQVLFRVGDIISLSLIKGGPEKEKLDAGLQAILAAAETNVRRSGVRSSDKLIELSMEDYDQAVYGLLNQSKIFIVKLTAARNVLWGETIPAQIDLLENKLVYKSGEEIASRDLHKGLTVAQAEEEITQLLRSVHQAARDAGILPDATGSLGSIPYSQISDLAKKIASARRSVTLKVFASQDIYLIGPLDIRFKIVSK